MKHLYIFVIIILLIVITVLVIYNSTIKCEFICEGSKQGSNTHSDDDTKLNPTTNSVWSFYNCGVDQGLKPCDKDSWKTISCDRPANCSQQPKNMCCGGELNTETGLCDSDTDYGLIYFASIYQSLNDNKKFGGHLFNSDSKGIGTLNATFINGDPNNIKSINTKSTINITLVFNDNSKNINLTATFKEITSGTSFSSGTIFFSVLINGKNCTLRINNNTTSVQNTCIINTDTNCVPYPNRQDITKLAKNEVYQFFTSEQIGEKSFKNYFIKFFRIKKTDDPPDLRTPLDFIGTIYQWDFTTNIYTRVGTIDITGNLLTPTYEDIKGVSITATFDNPKRTFSSTYNFYVFRPVTLGKQITLKSAVPGSLVYTFYCYQNFEGTKCCTSKFC